MDFSLIMFLGNTVFLTKCKSVQKVQKSCTVLVVDKEVQFPTNLANF
jgi:hypothetical protein